MNITRTLLAVVVCLFIVSTSVSAQTEPAPPSQPAGGNVNIRNCALQQPDDTLVVGCDFINAGSVQPDVRYAIQLMRAYENGTYELLDMQVYEEVLSISPGQTVRKEIPYTIPAYVSGEITVFVVGANSEGTQFSRVPAGTITRPAYNGVLIDRASCYLTVEGDATNTRYTLQQGVDIRPEERLVGHCTVVNRGTDSVTLQPSLETFRRSLYGERLVLGNGEATPVTIAGGESADYRFRLPSPGIPQAYDTKLSFSVGGVPTTNAAVFHYVVAGASATIQNVSADNDAYKKGDTASVTVTWTGSADDFPLSRLGGTQSSVQRIDVTIRNRAGAVCGVGTQEVSGSTGASLTDTAIMVPIDRHCTDPRVAVQIFDTDENTLAERSVAIDSAGIEWLPWVLGILAAVAVIGSLLFLRSRKRTSTSGMPMSLIAVIAGSVAIGGALFGGAPSAHAAMATGPSGAAYTFDIDRSLYQPGDAIQVSVSWQWSVCGNFNDQYSTNINATNMPTSETRNFGSSYKVVQPGSNSYTVEGFGSATFTAPATPGSYQVRFILDGQPSHVYYLYYTVEAPPPPIASLAANPSSIVAGETSTLTHNCIHATAATISGIGAVNPVSGSVSVSPSTTTTYTLTCMGAGGSTTAEATVSVGPPPDSAITASCSVNPTSIASGGSATWTATASGGSGVYAYGWTGTDGLSGTSSSVSKTYANPGTYTGSVTVTSGAQSTTVACTNTLSVTATPQADLTAGAVSPTSAMPNQGLTLSATATNIGNASSGAFPLLFEFQNPSQLRQSNYIIGLAQGGSNSASVPYVFNAAGSYLVRACANFNTSWTAITPESNYGNNCGPWTTITVASTPLPPPPPPPPPDEPAGGPLSCSVSDDFPTPGSTVTYSVTANNGYTGPFDWDDGEGGSYGDGPSASRTIPDSGSYGMSVSGGGDAAACSAVIAQCFNSTAEIEASSRRVRAGSPVTITWRASGIDDSCTVTGPGINRTINANMCEIPSESATPTINTQSVYRISCDDGEATDEVIVNVIPRFDEF